MLKVGDNVYPLVGLDTNVLSALAMDRPCVRRGYFQLFGVHIPCFSPYSPLELRRSPNVYEAFLEFFDVIPCAMLKNEEMLFEDERLAHPDSPTLDPTLLGFSVLNRRKGTNLRSALELGFTNSATLQREADWPDLKTELLGEWLKLKPNFEPSGPNYTPRDGCRFVDEAALQHIVFRAPDWSFEVANSGAPFVPEVFRSVRMTLWTIYFRLYWAHRRSGEVQDVFDALISTPAPYLDAVVTEKFQADIYRKVQALEPDLLNLTVYSLGDLAAAGRA